MFARHLAPVFLASTVALPLAAQINAPAPNLPAPPPANYDEALVGNHPLPPALTLQDGTPVKTAADWTRARRPEVLRLFEEHVYGRTPAQWGTLAFDTRAVKEDALGGTAIRKLVRIHLKEHPEWPGIHLLLYTPKKAAGPVPCFVGLNFKGNHAATKETDLQISEEWLRDSRVNPPKKGAPADPESTRGSEHSRWLPEEIIAAGYGLATAYYGDLEPDYAQGWKIGVRAALSPKGADTQWRQDEWGGIGAWAWGLSRMLDYLQTDRAVDAKRCAVIGHSRLGKTALWAGAQDERFSIVISNDSGEGGAALMRRNFGETVAIITSRFPHWFAGRFSSYATNEPACPVDQHLLIALAAPRPVAIGSASDDRWADPRGEFLSGKFASPVFALFGKTGITAEEPPPVGGATGDFVGYHLRAGEHDVKREDWVEYLKFCTRHWAR